MIYNLGGKWTAYEVKQQFHIPAIITIFKQIIPCGNSFNGELHDFWECFYLVSGEACVTENDHIYNLKTGDIIFHKPMSLHKFTITGKEDATILVFSYILSGNMASFFRDKVFHLNMEQKNILVQMMDYMQLCQSEHDFLIIKVLKDKKVLYDYVTKFAQIPTYLQTVTTYLYQLFLSLATDSTRTPQATSKETDIFSSTVSYMKENLCRNLTVSEIAQHNTVSQAALKRIFCKYAGMGIHKYFLILKLNYATKLLESGNSINEISEKLGFPNQSYFSRAYKREFGISPSSVKQRSL